MSAISFVPWYTCVDALRVFSTYVYGGWSEVDGATRHVDRMSCVGHVNDWARPIADERSQCGSGGEEVSHSERGKGGHQRGTAAHGRVPLTQIRQTS